MKEVGSKGRTIRVRTGNRKNGYPLTIPPLDVPGCVYVKRNGRLWYKVRLPGHDRRFSIHTAYQAAVGAQVPGDRGTSRAAAFVN